MESGEEVVADIDGNNLELSRSSRAAKNELARRSLNGSLSGR